MNVLHKCVGSHSINREDIHVNASDIGMMGTLYERCATIYHFSEITWIFWVLLSTECLIRFG